MRRILGMIVLFCSMPALGARAEEAVDPYASQVAQTEPLSGEEEQKTFQLPPGFAIQLVASEPEITKPINLNFDAAGRLYVTQSVEYPYAAAEGAPHRDSVKVLWDFGPDGHARQPATCASGLNIPIGVAPLSDSVLVYSIPNIYRCWDKDHDAISERREPLYGGFGHDDTHGMVNSLLYWVDGWVYACHGFRNSSTTQGTDGRPITMQSGNTFRIRPDGSHAEYVTHGQVNPFGLAFDPFGDMYSADCHTLPGYLLLRGAWYPSFGKPHDGLGYGPTLMSHPHGSTAISGAAYYAADHFPTEYQGTLFLGNPMTARINHDRLETHGSTRQAIEQPDFLASTDPWFRAVDIELGPDGALYVADFYNRIIGHYEVPLEHPGRDRERGRIWRIIYQGPDGKSPPPAMPIVPAEASLEQLVGLLGDPNLTLRTHAVQQLVDRVGPSAVAPLQRLLASGKSHPAQRAFGLWVVERLAGLDAALIKQLAGDPEPVVRVHLVKALGERAAWKNAEGDFADLVRGKLAEDDPFVRRAAAAALALHPDASNVKPLLDLWAATPEADTFLVHAARMALRDQLLAPGVYKEAASLASADPATAARLAEVSLGAPTSESAAYLLVYLQSAGDRVRLGEYLHHATRHIDGERLPEVLAFARTFEQAPPGEQLIAIRALDRALAERGAQAPAELRAWALKLARDSLAGTEEGRVRDGIELARELKLGELQPALEAAAGPEARFAGLRPSAIDACLANDAQQAIGLLSGILGDGREPVELRQKAAQSLGSVNSEAARSELSRRLPAAPDAVAITIAAGLSVSTEGGETLLEAVTLGKASPRLLLDRGVIERLRAANLAGFDERLAALTAGLAPADEAVNQLINERAGRFLAAQPDLALGKAVFQKACAACHKLAGQGTKIGPELDGIGQRGLARLLEDLLDPSRNVDQAFRGTQVATSDGRVVLGLKLREEGEVLILADALGKEMRIPLAEIEEQSVTQLSPMPANVAQVVTEADFQHLLAFLLSHREPPPPAAAP